MATFPRTIKPQFGYKSWQEENKKRNSSRSGKSEFKDNWGRTRFMADVPFDLRIDPGAHLAYGFWKDNRNLSFDFYDYDYDIFTQELIGVGTGTGAIYVVPADGIKSVLVYTTDVGGGNPVLKTLTTHYTILVGGGPLGQDRIDFVSPHDTSGKEIRVSYIGFHVWNCEWVATPEKASNAFNRHMLRFQIQERFP